MATLVLTAVGSAIGGPVGGAIGALLGQAVDGRLLRPKAREGPRLAELAVQTSSYGTQIPQMFGTMRVAGTVIWATDLIETRGTVRAGKGQPGVTTYSYAASFAVALSSRPIIGVGRIWAEGKLLRGAAGDFKTRTAFRFHTGGEDQAVDPLVASAEGVGRTPAHRGIAYAVFEQLDLTDFGNRIPSLTFEVIADPVAPSAGAVASALSPVIDARAGLMLDGFAASGANVRGVLETLGEASGAWFAVEGDRVRMRDVDTAVATIADTGVAARGRGHRRARTLTAPDRVASSVTVAHYDAARDYQTGLQRATRPGPSTRDLRIEVPAVIAAGSAKTIADRILARVEVERARRTVTAGFAALSLAPGDHVHILGEDGVWRITAAAIEDLVVRLDLLPVEVAPLPVAASGGRGVLAADLTIGATRIAMFETPALDDVISTRPRITVAANGAGAGWRQAALLYSVDGGASWIEAGATAAPATLGTLHATLPAGARAVFDMAGAIEVDLARNDLILGDADDDAIDREANVALIGDELVQFGHAARLGGTRWRLTRLLRGMQGTAVVTHPAGARFVLLESARARTIELPAGSVGATVRVMASGVGDATPVETTVIVTGESVAPPSPVRLRWTVVADGGLAVEWVRRSRSGWRWIDGVDAPIGEEREAYRVTVSVDAVIRRVEDIAASRFILPAVDRVAGAVVAVRQIGTNALSAPAVIAVPIP